MANRPAEDSTIVRRSRPNRSRQSSSLAAMMKEEEPEKEHNSASPDATKILSEDPPSAPEEEMLLIARRLRRAKRSLFLKSVEAPASPVDKFRSIVMTLSQQESRNLPALPFKTPQV